MFLRKEGNYLFITLHLQDSPNSSTFVTVFLKFYTVTLNTTSHKI